ncbi:hypothetical protein F2Q68_00016477 [Brassica cretica]|uniref:Uncharacterized protein n=2 Tax=Brassica cretica TaxID=69181 RepID=A0A8S9HC59_BRACR|nr:hypothetical protein F2Q68_00016477 [Brassica cretica]KAF3611187.1 hypothetical protein DY000_02048873 [Brassica cretica]
MVVDRCGIVDVDRLLRTFVDRVLMMSVDRSGSFSSGFSWNLICMITLCMLSSSSSMKTSSAPGVWVAISTEKLSWWCSSAQLPME